MLKKCYSHVPAESSTSGHAPKPFLITLTNATTVQLYESVGEKFRVGLLPK